ncbi:MAG TPA: galactose oxidase-like domain-containing protein, partial [Candidatus Sulfotelmatobacter sp.]
MYHPSRKATPQPAIQTTCGSELRHKPCSPLTLLLVATLVLTAACYAPVAQAQANVQGAWQTVSTQMPINPIHTALLSNGKILVVSGSGNYPAQTIYNVGVWDPSTNTMTIQTQSWDMFCNGMIVLPDGRPFIMGGNLQYDPFFGWNRTSIYNPAAVSPKPNFVDMEDMAHGRWYPTSTVLGDGRVLIFSGLDENGATNPQTEIYTVGAGWAPPVVAPWTPPLYPRLHVLPNGKVFYSGSTTQSRIFDPATSTWSGVIATTIYGGTRTYGSSVLLPLTPPNYAPKVMIFGGGNPATATTEIIDLSVPTPAWTKGPAMSEPRIEMNATILPNGQVLTVGGSLNDEDTSTASLNADLYDPATNKISSAGVNAVPRLYHSVALLLPDATVWVAGGNPVRGTYEPSVEIYSPAYLFNPDGTPATRPTITGVTPSVIGYGTSFQVQSPDAANIASAVLMKDGAVTHAFNMDQRLVGLTFTPGSGALTVTGPPSGNIAPPGYYMLFLINKAGVPSVAKFVQVSKAPTDVPPTGTITSPATPTVTINQAQSVTFAGTGTASGTGSIASFWWSIRGGSPAKSSMQTPGAVTFSTPGTYYASLTVTDNSGITDPNPPVVTIIVKPTSPPPTLTSATTAGLPATGAQGQTNLNIILTGTNFLPNPVCSFGAGVDVNSCTFNSATQLTANVDILANAAVGPRNILVTDTDTQTAPLANGFSVVAGNSLPAPTLTAVTPNAVFQGTT